MKRRNLLSLAALFGVSCEPVVFRLDPPTEPVSTASVTTPATTDACAPGCLGGRTCVQGECLPHWLPLTAPEIVSTEPRVGHYAVWTGAEVIVWGGHDPRPGHESRVYGDGLRIDPVRGVVRAISARLAPVARYDDGSGAAVWTGREMIVWGGRSGSGALGDGGAYVPALDAWVRPPAGTMTPTAVAPVSTRDGLVFVPFHDPTTTWRASAGLGDLTLQGGRATSLGVRRRHGSAYTGSELIVWGGLDEAGRARDDGWRFSLARRRSRPLPAAPARAWHSATWAESQLIVFGGRDAMGRMVSAPMAYVPAIDAWRELTSSGAPLPRVGHVAVWTGDSLLVWGGTDGVRALADGAAYDPWDDAWHPLPGLEAERGVAIARDGAVGVWTGTELVIVGGWDHGERVVPLGWRYQP